VPPYTAGIIRDGRTHHRTVHAADHGSSTRIIVPDDRVRHAEVKDTI
jgi:hypothetical protein